MADVASTLGAAVIADDVTGANASAALLLAAGLRAFTALDSVAAEQALSQLGVEALAVSTGSRNLAPAQAAERVRLLAEQLVRAHSVRLNKRIDSTLRGNLGAELDAVLEVFQRRVCRQACAVVVAAHPRGGRICLGGYLLVNGLAVSETEAARDPYWPVRQSEVLKVLAQQSRRSMAHVPLGAVLGGRESLLRALTRAASAAEIVLVDAVTDHHLETIADALDASPIPYLLADPGPAFAAWIARGVRGSKPSGGYPGPAPPHIVKPADTVPPLVIAGSSSLKTIEQVRLLLTSRRAAVVLVDPDKIGRNEGPGTINGAAEELAHHCSRAQADALEAIVLATAAPPAAPCQAGAELGAATARALACVAARALAGCKSAPPGLVVTGGDVALAVCEALGGRGIEPLGEIEPLIVAGRLRGGPYSGLALCTKGGLVGSPGALEACVDWLRRVPALA